VSEEKIKLKNGSEEIDSLVAATLSSIYALLMENSGVLHYLFKKCKDDNYNIPPEAVEILKDKALLEESGSVHSSIRNIVLSAFEVDGQNIKITSPLA